jgi:hypothetical protein
MNSNSNNEGILVALSASDNLVGRIIRALTGSSVNHAFILYESDLWGGWWAAQIDERGVRKLPAKVVLPTYEKVYLYRYMGKSLAVGLKACRYMVGWKYDWLGILGFICKLVVWRLIGRRIFNPLHGRNREFCSEFVSNVLKKTPVPSFENQDPASLSPGDVLSIIKTDPFFRKVELSDIGLYAEAANDLLKSRRGS